MTDDDTERILADVVGIYAHYLSVSCKRRRVTKAGKIHGTDRATIRREAKQLRELITRLLDDQ